MRSPRRKRLPAFRPVIAALGGWGKPTRRLAILLLLASVVSAAAAWSNRSSTTERNPAAGVGFAAGLSGPGVPPREAWITFLSGCSHLTGLAAKADGSTVAACARRFPNDGRHRLISLTSDGEVSWSQLLLLAQHSVYVATGPDGQIAVAGLTGPDIEHPDRSALLLLDPDGHRQWRRTSLRQSFDSVIFDAEGNVYPLQYTYRTRRPSVAKISSTGITHWMTDLRVPYKNVIATQIAYDEQSESIYVSGSAAIRDVTGSIHGDENRVLLLWKLTSVGDIAWRAELRPADFGHPEWSDVYAKGLVVGGNGVTVAGEGGFFEATPRPDVDLDVVVARFRRDGGLEWARAHGTKNRADLVSGIAEAGGGKLYVAGSTACDSLQECEDPLGGGSLLAVLSPMGRVIWWRPPPTDRFTSTVQIAATPVFDALLGGPYPRPNGTSAVAIMKLRRPVWSAVVELCNLFGW
jgi:hypothetical protein